MNRGPAIWWVVSKHVMILERCFLLSVVALLGFCLCNLDYGLFLFHSCAFSQMQNCPCFTIWIIIVRISLLSDLSLSSHELWWCKQNMSPFLTAHQLCFASYCTKTKLDINAPGLSCHTLWCKASEQKVVYTLPQLKRRAAWFLIGALIREGSGLRDPQLPATPSSRRRKGAAPVCLD